MFQRVMMAAMILGAVVAWGAVAEESPGGNDLRVMSFNIRNSHAMDLLNSWGFRKEMVRDLVRADKIDLLGMQEVLQNQAEYVQKNLPEYGFIGTGRDDGKTKGEYSPILFRKDRLEAMDSGQFWLSATPEVVGSKGWDAALPRIVTWAKLRDKANGRVFFYLNSHWDHVGKVARVESAKLIVRWIGEHAANEPVIVTGDFNSNEDSPAYAAMLAGTDGVKLSDSYREIHPQRSPEEASYHGFKGTKTGSRIDFVLHTQQFTARSAAIDYTQKDGRWPSDHFPVTAELAWKN